MHQSPTRAPRAWTSSGSTSTGCGPAQGPCTDGRREAMHVFSLEQEQVFDPRRHVEKILGTGPGGDFTVACWEPGQVSPYHCHPDATEIYFCFSGGGVMRTPQETAAIQPGGFVVHPPGELHEYENGPARSLLFRVRVRAGHFCAIHRVARPSGVGARAEGRRLLCPESCGRHLRSRRALDMMVRRDVPTHRSSADRRARRHGTPWLLIRTRGRCLRSDWQRGRWRWAGDVPLGGLGRVSGILLRGVT